MSAIQGVYSINVSNRFDLGNGEEDEADADELIDPLERLKKLEEQRERERALKKQEKAQQANKKPQKKGAQFRENKDVNITKKENTGRIVVSKTAEQIWLKFIVQAIVLLVQAPTI